jgi:hypothetical protein
MRNSTPPCFIIPTAAVVNHARQRQSRLRLPIITTTTIIIRILHIIIIRISLPHPIIILTIGPCTSITDSMIN